MPRNDRPAKPPRAVRHTCVFNEPVRDTQRGDPGAPFTLVVVDDGHASVALHLQSGLVFVGCPGRQRSLFTPQQIALALGVSKEEPE